MANPTVLSIQTGKATTRELDSAFDKRAAAWTSAIFKAPVAGTIFLSRLGLDGDEQADTFNHGGVDKAALLYGAAHYPAWRTELDRPDAAFGAFGETFTIGDQTEETVCIGDVYRIGTVEVEVSQPRTPCWKLARRWQVRDMMARVNRSGRPGWYVRVLREGYVGAGLPVMLLERPYPAWTVARVSATYNFGRDDVAANAELARLAPLAEGWREVFAKRAE